MKNKFFIFLALSFAFLLFFIPVRAQETTISSDTQGLVETLKRQIEVLQTRIAELQAEVVKINIQVEEIKKNN